MRLQNREITNLTEIGQDAFGRVFKGVWGDRSVAVRSAEAFEQYSVGDTTELSSCLQGIHHQALPTYYGVGREKYPFLVMDFIDGNDLSSRLRGTEIGSPVSPNFLQCTQNISGALAELHNVGLAHGCVTARNVLFGNSNVHLVDMTFVPPARQVEAAPKRYLAPEWAVAAGESSRIKMDLYGLGVVLFELGTGMEFPGVFRASDLGGTALEPIASIVARLLDRDPEARYGEAREVLNDLEIAGGDRSISVDTLRSVAAAPAADYELFADIERKFFEASRPHVEAAIEKQTANGIASDAIAEASELLSALGSMKIVARDAVKEEVAGLGARLQPEVAVEPGFVDWRARQVAGLLAAHWVALLRESVADSDGCAFLAAHLLPWSQEHAPSLRRDQQEAEFSELVDQLVIERDAVNAILEQLRKEIENPHAPFRLPGGITIERRDDQLAAVSTAG